MQLALDLLDELAGTPAQLDHCCALRWLRLAEEDLTVARHTAADPELEIWGGRRKGDLFEELFAKKLKFTVEKE